MLRHSDMNGFPPRHHVDHGLDHKDESDTESSGYSSTSDEEQDFVMSANANHGDGSSDDETGPDAEETLWNTGPMDDDDDDVPFVSLPVRARAVSETHSDEDDAGSGGVESLFVNRTDRQGIPSVDKQRVVARRPPHDAPWSQRHQDVNT